MTHAEYESWIAFYNAHPFDDEHLVYRPAALIAARPTGGFKMDDALAYLRHEPPPEAPAGVGEVGLSFLKVFGLTPPGKKE